MGTAQFAIHTRQLENKLKYEKINFMISFTLMKKILTKESYSTTY